MSVKRLYVYTCDYCGYEVSGESIEDCFRAGLKGYRFIPAVEGESKHRCENCPSQPNEMVMGKR
jgi:hypothetical protein